MHRIRIDDDDVQSDDSVNKSSNESDHTLSADSTLSAGEPSEYLATVSLVESKAEQEQPPEDEMKPAESEQKIIDLLTGSNWVEAVKVYRIHKARWPGTLPLGGAQGVIGSVTEEDDVCAMLNLFCASLAEKSNIFVMTLNDVDIGESCSRLMDAIQQLSQTVKSLEAYQAKHRPSPPLVTGATGTLLPPSKQQQRSASRSNNTSASDFQTQPPSLSSDQSAL